MNKKAANVKNKHNNNATYSNQSTNEQFGRERACMYACHPVKQHACMQKEKHKHLYMHIRAHLCHTFDRLSSLAYFYCYRCHIAHTQRQDDNLMCVINNGKQLLVCCCFCVLVQSDLIILYVFFIFGDFRRDDSVFCLCLSHLGQKNAYVSYIHVSSFE